MTASRFFSLITLALFCFLIACNGKKTESSDDTAAQVDNHEGHDHSAHSPPPAPETPEEFVQQCFQDFKTAVSQSEATLMLVHAEENTLAYFDRLRELTINGTESEVKALLYPERSIILGARALERPKVLRRMDGEGFLVFVSSYGLLDKTLIKRFTIGTAAIDESSLNATAPVLMDGKEVEGLSLNFKHPGEFWKMDATPLITYMNERMDTQITSSVADPNGQLMKIVNAMTGGNTPENIWGPLPQE